MSYELIIKDRHFQSEISDYEYSFLTQENAKKYRRKVGSTTDHSDRSHVGTYSTDNFVSRSNDFSNDTPSSDDSFSGFGGGSGGGSGAGSSWDSDSSSSSDSSSYDSGSSDSGSSSSD